MIETVSFLVGCGISAAIIACILFVMRHALIDDCVRENRIIRIKLEALESKYQALYDYIHNTHKKTINKKLGIGTGRCPRCGKVLFDEELVDKQLDEQGNVVKNILGEEIILCPKCKLELC